MTFLVPRNLNFTLTRPPLDSGLSPPRRSPRLSLTRSVGWAGEALRGLDEVSPIVTL